MANLVSSLPQQEFPDQMQKVVFGDVALTHSRPFDKAEPSQ